MVTQKTNTAIRTISDQIKAGSTIEISIKNFHTKDVLHISDDKKIIMNTLSILNEYWQFIQPYIVQVNLSDEEVMRYEYKPKLLSYELYGTIEMYYLILRINYMDSVSDFTNIKKLKIFNGGISSFLNEVYVKEKKKINTNNSLIREESVE